MRSKDEALKDRILMGVKRNGEFMVKEVGTGTGMFTAKEYKGEVNFKKRTNDFKTKDISNQIRSKYLFFLPF